MQAIKSISHLDRLDNWDSYGTFMLGETNSLPTLRFFTDSVLTDGDKNTILAAESEELKTESTTYWGSLFEISKPITPSKSDSKDTAEYES